MHFKGSYPKLSSLQANSPCKDKQLNPCSQMTLRSSPPDADAETPKAGTGPQKVLQLQRPNHQQHLCRWHVLSLTLFLPEACQQREL